MVLNTTPKDYRQYLATLSQTAVARVCPTNAVQILKKKSHFCDLKTCKLFNKSREKLLKTEYSDKTSSQKLKLS